MSYPYRTTPLYQIPSPNPPSSWHPCMHTHTHPSITICSKNALHQMTPPPPPDSHFWQVIFCTLQPATPPPPPTVLTDHIFNTLSAPSSPSTTDWSRRPPLVRSTSETGGNPHTPTTPDPSLPCDCQYTAWSPHELSNHSVWTTAKTWGNEKLKKDGNGYKWFLWLYKASLEFYNFFINI